MPTPTRERADLQRERRSAETARLASICWGDLVVQRRDDWLTPPYILDALGPFDLGPCASLAMPWATATRQYTVEEDGLQQQWSGRVWLNPPYSNAAAWVKRLSRHGIGTALVFARTETSWWFESVWGHGTLALFLRGRVTFRAPDGSPSRNGHSTSPSVLVAYGERDAVALEAATERRLLVGHLVDLRRSPATPR